MSAQVIPSVYSSPNQVGDFGWMLLQPQYQDCFFIFNDNEEQFLAHRADPTGIMGCAPGSGNGAIRPFQCKTPQHVSGIPTGVNQHGYKALTPHVTQMVDDALDTIVALVQKNNLTKVYFSADKNGDLGGKTFHIDPAVKKYIVAQIWARFPG